MREMRGNFAAYRQFEGEAKRREKEEKYIKDGGWDYHPAIRTGIYLHKRGCCCCFAFLALCLFSRKKDFPVQGIY